MITNSAAKLSAYANRLASCSGESCEHEFQEIADLYEDDLLESETFPADYFRFLINLLSMEAFYQKAGLWHFLVILNSEQGKLEANHYDTLAECIIKNYGQYADADLCFAACDFIARNYPESEARRIFLTLAEVETSKSAPLHGIVGEGIKILEAEVRRAQKRSDGSRKAN